MADHDLHRELRLFYKRLPKPTVGVIALVIILSATIGFTFGQLPTESTLRLFLSALAGAQASLIGIVFAVTILGIQLVSDRYSVRLARLFYRHPVFLLTLALFLSSIALDLGLLFTLRSAGTSFYHTAIYATIGLAIGNGFALIAFVRTALDLNTPEGIIEAYSESITPEDYVSWGRSEDDISSPPHPLYDLHLMSIEAFKHDDLETADKAIDGYGRLAVSLLEAILDRELLGEKDAKELTELYEDVFRIHIPEMAMHADENGENSVVYKSIEWQYRIGRTGLEIDHPRLADDALRGLTWTATRDVPVEMEHYSIHSEVWNYAGELVKDAAELAEPGRVDRILLQTNSLEQRHLTHAFDHNVHYDLVTDYLSGLQEAHKTVLERSQSEVKNSEFDWQSTTVLDDIEHREHFEDLLALRKEVCNFSAKIPRHVSETEAEYPVIDGPFARTWKEFCLDAIKLGPDEYGQTLCQAMIELAYIDSLVYPPHDRLWSSRLAEIYEKHPDVVDAAFEFILSYDKLDMGDELIPVIDETWEDQYHNFVQVSGYSPLNAHEGFPGRLESLRKRIRERSE